MQLGRERLNATPGVEASASSCYMPLEGGFGLPFIVVGRPLGKEKQTGGAGWMSASPGYFEVFRIPTLRGLDFTETDRSTSPGVVLINQSMAKKFWPKDDPVGQQIIIGKGCRSPFEEPARQIIGVVGDMRDGGLNRDPRPLIIVLQAQSHRRHDSSQSQHRSGRLVRPYADRSAPIVQRDHRTTPSGR